MILRRATADDAPACAAIVAGWLSGLDWMPDPPTVATLEPLLRDGLPKREAWVADKGGETRGYLSLDPETAHIHALYTVDLSRNCSAPLAWYFATKEKHHGIDPNPGLPRRGSADSVNQRAAT